MVDIAENGIIAMNPGEYFQYPLFINAGSKLFPLRYILNRHDQVYFSIMEKDQPFEMGIVRKIFTSKNLNTWGDVIIELNSSDTEHILPGIYYYQILLSYIKDDKAYDSIIVPPRKFYLL